MDSGHIIFDATVIALNFGTGLIQLAALVVVVVVVTEVAVAVALFVTLDFGANPGNLLSNIPSTAPVHCVQPDLATYVHIYIGIIKQPLCVLELCKACQAVKLDSR